MIKNKIVDSLKYKISELGLSTINVDNDDMIVVVDKDMYIIVKDEHIFVCFGNDMGRLGIYTANEEGVDKLKKDLVASSIICDKADTDDIVTNAISGVNVPLINGISVRLYDLIKEYGSLEQIPLNKYQEQQDPVCVEPVIVHNKKEYDKINLGNNVVETCTYIHKINNIAIKRNYERVINRLSGEVLSTKIFDVPVEIEDNPLLNNTETLSEFRANYDRIISNMDPEVYIEDISDRCVNSTKKCIVGSKRLVDRKVVVAFDDYNYIFIRICESASELQSALVEDERLWYRFRFNHMVIYSAIKFVMGGAFVIDWVVNNNGEYKVVQLLDANKVGRTDSHSAYYDFCEYGLKSMFLRRDLSGDDVQTEIENANMVMIMARQKEDDNPKPYFEDVYYQFPYGYKPNFTQSLLDLNHVYAKKIDLNSAPNYNNSGNLNNLGGFTMNNAMNSTCTNMVYEPQQNNMAQGQDNSVMSQSEQITQPNTVEPVSNGTVRIILNKEPENFIDGEMPRTESGVIDFSALTTGRPLQDVLEDNKLENHPEYVEQQQNKQRTVTQSIEVIRNFAVKQEEQKVVPNFSHLADPNYNSEIIVNPKFENPENRQTLINENAFYGGPVVNPFSVTVDDIPIIERMFQKEESQARELLSNIKVLDSEGNVIERDNFNIWNSWLLQNGMQPEDLIPDHNGDVHVGGNMNYQQRTSNSLLMQQHLSKTAKEEENSDDSFEISNLKELYLEKNKKEEEPASEPEVFEAEVIEEVVEKEESDIKTVNTEDDEFEYILDEEALKSNIEYKSHMSAIKKLEKEIATKGKSTVRERKLKSHIKYIEILKENFTIKIPKNGELVESESEMKEDNVANIISVDYIINFIKEILNSKGIIPTEKEWDDVVNIIQTNYDKEMIANYLIDRINENAADPIYLDVLENGTHSDGEFIYARDTILTSVFNLDLNFINQPLEYDENSLAQESVDYIRGVLSLHRITDILKTDEEICDMLFKGNDENDVMNYILSSYENCMDDTYKRLLGFIIANRKLALGNIIYNKDALLQTVYHFVNSNKAKESDEIVITPEFCLDMAMQKIPNLNIEEFAEFISKDVTEEYVFRRFGQILRKLGKAQSAKYKPLRNHNRLEEVRMFVLTDDYIISESN